MITNNYSPYIDRYRRFRERGVNFVNRNRIERIRGIATDIDDDAKLSSLARGDDLLLCDK